MRKIHQLVHTLSYGDAISSEVMLLKRVLNSMGIESEIFAINVHPKYKKIAKCYEELEDFNCEIILHYSLGSILNDYFIENKFQKKYMRYHNITPAKWFAQTNPRVKDDILAGIKGLETICKASDKIISASEFNAKEIRELGFESEVLHLVVNLERFVEEANPGIAAQLNDGRLHVVHIGRLAPNKKIEDIIRAFYFLHQINKDAMLWLSGIDIDTELYTFGLRRMIMDFDLKDHVKFVGQFADCEIKALYENGTCYLCMSEHEGFGVPAIESMHFGLPFLGFAEGAIPEIVGDGGILFSEKKYLEIALLINKIYLEPEFRKELVDAGYERLKFFSQEKFSNQVKVIFDA